MGIADTLKVLSYHLRLLKAADLVMEYRQKNYIYYELNTTVLMPFFPDRIPMHYDMAGNIDRWGSKYENYQYLVFGAGISKIQGLRYRSGEENSKKMTFFLRYLEGWARGTGLKTVRCYVILNNRILREIGIISRRKDS